MSCLRTAQPPTSRPRPARTLRPAGGKRRSMILLCSARAGVMGSARWQRRWLVVADGAPDPDGVDMGEHEVPALQPSGREEWSGVEWRGVVWC
jgi:hypothetical protein